MGSQNLPALSSVLRGEVPDSAYDSFAVLETADRASRSYSSDGLCIWKGLGLQFACPDSVFAHRNALPLTS